MARQTPRPRRCNYCPAPATTWLRYTGGISRDIRPRTGGDMVLWVAACPAHVGCVNWNSHLALRDRHGNFPELVTAP